MRSSKTLPAARINASVDALSQPALLIFDGSSLVLDRYLDRSDRVERFQQEAGILDSVLELEPRKSALAAGG
jgi:hypothetical protein